MISFFISILMSVAVQTADSPAPEDVQTQKPETQPEKDSPQKTDGPLTVRVTPLKKLKTKPLTPDQLRDAPVFLKDGTLITFGDWVMGALKRGDVDSRSSDLEQQQFLGRVAEAIAGAGGELLNEGQPVHVGPLLPGGMAQDFIDAPLSEELAALQGVICIVFCVPQEATEGAYDYSYRAANLAKAPLIGGAGADSPLFQNQMARDMSWAYADWKKRQLMMDVIGKALKDARKELEAGKEEGGN